MTTVRVSGFRFTDVLTPNPNHRRATTLSALSAELIRKRVGRVLEESACATPNSWQVVSDASSEQLAEMLRDAEPPPHLLELAHEMPLPGQYEVLYDKSPLAEICLEVLQQRYPVAALTLTLYSQPQPKPSLTLPLAKSLALARCFSRAAPCRGAFSSHADRRRRTGLTFCGRRPAPRSRAWARRARARAPRSTETGACRAATTWHPHQESRCSSYKLCSG